MRRFWRRAAGPGEAYIEDDFPASDRAVVIFGDDGRGMTLDEAQDFAMELLVAIRERRADLANAEH